jgi:hypothetical protein
MKLQTRSFLNVKVSPMKRKKRKDETGERYPNHPDRMACRERFQRFWLEEHTRRNETQAKGAFTVSPHELVKLALEETNPHVLHSLQSQWVSIRADILKRGKLSRMVPLADCSGSMDGTPKLVSLALGILVSEVNHPTFRNRLMTFDAEPRWHVFSEEDSLAGKVRSVLQAEVGQGLHTNVQKALELILERLVDGRVPVGEEPEDILILTYMGWDQVTGSRFVGEGQYDTLLEVFRKAFRAEGEKLWGTGRGWKVPRFVVWNLREQYKEFPCQAHTEGVVILSGWSPSALQTIVEKGISLQTPYQALRIVLDNPRYDAVRQAVSA